MNLSFIQPPQMAWASGALADGPLLRKSTRIQDLTDVLPMKTPVSNWLVSRSCMTLRCWIRLPLKVNSTPALPIFILAGSAASIL